MLNSSNPTPEITITGAIEAVKICTTENVGMGALRLYMHHGWNQVLNA
jgi:hypothetical protein